MPQVPWNRAKVGQNHDARKEVSATLSVLKWSGAIFRPRSSKVSVQKVLLFPFNWKRRPSGVSLASPGLENIRQLQENRAKVGQNHHVRKAVSATLSVLKWSGAMFWPISSKVSVQKVLLFPFNWKQRPSGVNLASPGLENIRQLQGNRANVAQNHDVGKAVSATLLVLKWRGVIFRRRSSRPGVP